MLSGCWMDLRVRTRVRGQRVGGFSLVELVAVIGILMILAGLLAPALAGSWSRAKLTRDMMLIRQSAASVMAYSQDFSDCYPFESGAHPIRFEQSWFRPVLASGHIATMREIDPEYATGRGMFSVAMSLAMCYDPAKMRPGNTEPFDAMVASPVRQSQVVFPSSKGLLIRWHSGDPDRERGFASFCGSFLWPAPVAMADGSSMSGTCLDFLRDEPLYTENEIGYPVIETWYGARGIDK